MPSEHTIQRRVQFAETDQAGFVHFTCFFRYMEEAEHALWREAGLSIYPREGEIGFPRLATSFEYHRPLRFEDEFEISIQVAEIGERTMSYRCLLTRGGERIATGSLKIACVRKVAGEPMKMIPIPADIASRFVAAEDAGRAGTPA